MKAKKIVALWLTVLALLGVWSGAAFAASGVPGYVIDGNYNSSDNTYQLVIRVENVQALTGRIGLAFDTSKVDLAGASDLSAFQLSSDIRSVDELKGSPSMVSGKDGYACLAWYVNSDMLDTTTGAKEIATLRFQLNNGITTSDFDSATFRLMYIDEETFAPWESPLSIDGKGNLAPVLYRYLVDGAEACGVRFVYDGADKTPTAGNDIKIVCKNALKAPVAAVLELNGETYRTDANGEIALKLVDGDYLYRSTASGYGTLQGKLTVSGAGVKDFTFVNDADLVKAATDSLQIGFHTGDSANYVSQNLILPKKTDTGVTIAWQSSEPNVITKDGLVYPAKKSTKVNLVATLSKGNAKGSKSFDVTVVTKDQASSAKPGGNGNGTDNTTDTTKNSFQDLTGYDWAKAAINRLTAAGIIKGTGQNTFSPGENVKRGDFVVLLVRMLNPEGSGNEAFADVPKDSYYYKEIALAKSLGLVTGMEDGAFRPNQPISRQDMMTIVNRAMAKTGFVTLGEAADLSKYPDSAKVSAYAKTNVAVMVGSGFITGDANGNLNPLQYTTRAETAVFLDRIYRAKN